MKLLKREIDFKSEEMDQELILDFSICSNTPIQREFGMESLVIDAVSVDLDRLKNAGNVLFGHDDMEVVGVILDAYVKDNNVRVKAKFSENSEYFGMIKDGTLRSVSIGYIVNEQEKRGDIYYATKWEIFEVSIVSIPADYKTVGLYRSVENDEKLTPVITITENTNNFRGNKTMENINYEAIGREYNLSAEDVKFAERSNLNMEQVQQLIIKNLQSKPVSTSAHEPELSKKEVRNYNISNAILAKVKGSGVSADYELEISRAIEKQTGRSTNGIFIPAQVLAERTMLAGGTNHLGEDFVADVFDTSNYLGYAFNRTLGAVCGVTYLPGLVSNILIPKTTSAGVFQWVGETGEIALSNISGSQVALTPKRGGAATSFSMQLLRQATPSINNWLIQNINDSVSVGMDLALFSGTGNSNQPQGILNAGIPTLSGSSFTYAQALQFPATVAGANRLNGNLSWVASPSTVAVLSARAKESGYPTYIMENRTMAGYTCHESNQISAGNLLFGDFSKALVGQFSGIEITIDEFTQARSGLIVLTVQTMMDVAVLDTNAFCKAGPTLVS